MEKDRLLAFSDGVVAIIITIMVLELKDPAWRKLGGFSWCSAGFLKLRLKLRVCGHLLE